MLGNRYPMTRLDISSAHNLRDLGGYCAKNSTVTKFGKFLRSDVLTKLDGQGAKILSAYPLKLVIDLRDETEIITEISEFNKIPGATVVHIPLLERYKKSRNIQDFSSDKERKKAAEQINSMGDLYAEVAKNCGADFVRIFELFAQNIEATTLFHCTAGKDRTGMVAALLLDLVGVSRSDIISNYQISHTLILQKFEIAHDDANIMNMMGSEPAYIMQFMRYIEKNFGNAEKYLIKSGLSKQNIALIRTGLLERMI